MAKSSFDNEKIGLCLSGFIIAGSFALSANVVHAAQNTILLASAAKTKKVRFTPIIDGDLLPFISVTSQKLNYLEPAAIYKFPVKMGRNCRLYVIGLFGVKPLRWPGWNLTKWNPKTGEIEYQKEVGHGIVEDQIPLIVSLPSDTTIDVLRPHFRATCGKGDAYHEARSNDYIGVSGSQSQPGASDVKVEIGLDAYSDIPTPENFALGIDRRDNSTQGFMVGPRVELQVGEKLNPWTFSGSVQYLLADNDYRALEHLVRFGFVTLPIEGCAGKKWYNADGWLLSNIQGCGAYNVNLNHTKGENILVPPATIRVKGMHDFAPWPFELQGLAGTDFGFAGGKATAKWLPIRITNKDKGNVLRAKLGVDLTANTSREFTTGQSSFRPGAGGSLALGYNGFDGSLGIHWIYGGGGTAGTPDTRRTNDMEFEVGIAQRF
jgi:hypothetical protein